MSKTITQNVPKRKNKQLKDLANRHPTGSPILRLLDKETRKKADKIKVKILNEPDKDIVEVLSPEEQKFLNSPDVRLYVTKTLEAANLTDPYLGERLKKIIDAGTTDEALKWAKPMVALQAIRTTAQLKDLFPATKIEARTTNIDLQFKGASLTDLKAMLEKLHARTQQFFSMSSSENE